MAVDTPTTIPTPTPTSTPIPMTSVTTPTTPTTPTSTPTRTPITITSVTTPTTPTTTTTVSDNVEAELDVNQLILLLQGTAGELLKAVDAVKTDDNVACAKIIDTLKSLSILYALLTAFSESCIMDKEGDAWFRRGLHSAVDSLSNARDSTYKFILMGGADELEGKRSELDAVYDATVAFLDRFKFRIGVHVTTAGRQVEEPVVSASGPEDHREVMLKQLRHFGEKSMLLGDPIRAIATLMVGSDGQKRSLDKLTQMAKAGHVPELIESGAVSAVCRYVQSGEDVPATLLALLAGEGSENVEVFRRCGGEAVVRMVEVAREQEAGPVAPATPILA